MGKSDRNRPPLVIEQTSEETKAEALARKLLEPHLRHAVSAAGYIDKLLGKDIDQPSVIDLLAHYHATAGKAEGGDLSLASQLLASQAITLDSIFTEMSRRAALNMGEYIDAAERYTRMALRAQSNCRSTLEALAKLHQPREQTVRHVHVNQGGQAVVADQFHHHEGGANGKGAKQSHATDSAGNCAALPGQDASGVTVPVTGRKRKKAVQNARRDKPRRA